MCVEQVNSSIITVISAFVCSFVGGFKSVTLINGMALERRMVSRLIALSGHCSRYNNVLNRLQLRH